MHVQEGKENWGASNGQYVIYDVHRESPCQLGLLTSEVEIQKFKPGAKYIFLFICKLY